MTITQKPAAKKGRSSRKVVEDSDEEEPAPKPKKAAPAKTKKREPTPEGETTTTADYFGDSKPKRTEALRPQSKAKAADATPKPSPVKAKSTPSKAKETPTKNAPGSARSSTRRKAATTYKEEADDDDDNADDVFKAECKKGGKGLGDDYDEDDDLEKDMPKPKRTTRGKGKQAKVKDEDLVAEEDVDMKDVEPEDDFVVPDDDEEMVEDKPAAKAQAKAGSKRKAKSVAEDGEEDETPKKKPKTATKKAPASKAKKEEVQDSKEIQAIMNSIPTIRAPSPPAKDDGDGKRKFPFGGAHANSGPPPEAGSKELPVGAENCLAGLSFVFTGLLQTLSRDDGTELVKRHGGKVMGAPSGKTSFIVLGSDAGPSKLAKIKQFGLKTIDEDGLFELVKKLPANGGDSKAAAHMAATKAKEEDKIREMAAEMEKQDRRSGGAGGAGGGKTSAQTPAKGKGPEVDSRLWTVKYAPQQLAQICGNKAQVDKLQRWLKAFPKNHRTKFKMPGADGSGTYRAVMIHGPPGIGKTTAAHLVAKLEGYDIVESNASDTRSKKMVEQGLKGVLDTRSLMGYFSSSSDVEASKKKLVLIMDEVDGMSAGDRGGVGALAAVCKKSEIPMILICNDRKQPKMKPFDYCTYDLPFRRPTTDQIRSRIMTILFRENMKMPPQVINALIDGTGADIRQVVNMVSTAKLDETAMDFDKSKEMSKSWEKHIILKPWDITGKILGGGMFASTSKATLNEKIELYFNDHEFSPLMLQENYLGTNPILTNQAPNDKMRRLKHLDLVCKAADSISDGDLVDRMIHGSQQQWSLMPAHGVFSFVRPASFVSGSMAGNQTRFTSWLGNNSKGNKLVRFVKEIQGHMRLRTTGDRHEIRQQYVPLLWQQLVKRQVDEGKECIDDVISLMDSYYLTKDDYDAVIELGVGPMDMEGVKVETQVKTAFTRA